MGYSTRVAKSRTQLSDFTFTFVKGMSSESCEGHDELGEQVTYDNLLQTSYLLKTVASFLSLSMAFEYHLTLVSVESNFQSTHQANY